MLDGGDLIIAPGTRIEPFVIGGKFSTTRNSRFYHARRVSPFDGRKYLFKWLRLGVSGALRTEPEINELLKGCPNAVIGFNRTETHGSVGFFMDFYSMPNLYDHLTSQFYIPSERTAAHLSYRIVVALAHIHGRGFAHRDLKPDNILLEEGESDIPNTLLADFGLAAYRRQGEHFTDFVGTLEYCAPEIHEHVPYTEAADMWSFGVLLYELLTQDYPFGHTTSKDGPWRKRILKGEYSIEGLRVAIPDISMAALDLVQRLLVVDPNQRPSAEEAMRHEFFSEVSRNVKQSLQSVDRALLDAEDFDGSETIDFSVR